MRKLIRAEKRWTLGRKKGVHKKTKAGLQGYRFLVTKGSPREEENDSRLLLDKLATMRDTTTHPISSPQTLSVRWRYT
jgi:hypothetical protein